MKILRHKWAGTALAIGLVIFNGVFVFRLVGLSYSRFSWEAWAQVYDPTPGNDTDGDGIKDTVDPHPNQFDPSGCFYDRFNGRIVPGGLITASGPGTVTVGLNGSTGCFQAGIDTPGTLSLTIARVPPRCHLDPSCPNLGTLTVNGFTSLGFSADPSKPGFLLGGGQCTPYYLDLQFSDPGDAVITNNIALVCIEPAPAPMLSGWGWYALVLSLILVGGLKLRSQFGRRA